MECFATLAAANGVDPVLFFRSCLNGTHQQGRREPGCLVGRQRHPATFKRL
jgi:hypothetical protein